MQVYCNFRANRELTEFVTLSPSVKEASVATLSAKPSMETTKKSLNYLSNQSASNMVLLRPNSTSSNNSNNNNNSSSNANTNTNFNLINYYGDSRNQKMISKPHSHKGKNGIDETVIHQRTITPIILTKPTANSLVKVNLEQENVTLVRNNKDENSKPLLSNSNENFNNNNNTYSRSSTGTLLANKSLAPNKNSTSNSSSTSNQSPAYSTAVVNGSYLLDTHSLNKNGLSSSKNSLSSANLTQQTQTSNSSNGTLQQSHSVSANLGQTNTNGPILSNLSTNLNGSPVNLNKLKQQLNSQKEAVTATTAATLNSLNSTTQSSSSLGPQQIDSVSARLNTAPAMTTCVKLLDENLQWQENLSDFLIDQNDFLVIGVLGKKGVGKSTLMSLLAGCKFDENHNLFKSAPKEIRELAQHKSNGIQVFITAERTILLDVQPLLSGSVLDKTINVDKKHLGNDFKYYENYVEIQSIELACFVLSVCNVVLVTEDWFIDPNLFRLLQTAEMLIPNMHQVAFSSTGSSNSSIGTSNVSQLNAQLDEYHFEHHPHLVYVLNKSEHLNKVELIKMKSCIDNLMKDSKLIYKGSINEFGSHLQTKRRQHSSSISGNSKLSTENVNFVIMPKVEKTNRRDQSIGPMEFIGVPSIERCVNYLLREILAVKRTHCGFQMNHQSNLSSISSSASGNTNNLGFSEKRWFSYANKVWETIRKSPLIAEYNRLMT